MSNAYRGPRVLPSHDDVLKYAFDSGHLSKRTPLGVSARILVEFPSHLHRFTCSNVHFFGGDEYEFDARVLGIWMATLAAPTNVYISPAGSSAEYWFTTTHTHRCDAEHCSNLVMLNERVCEYHTSDVRVEELEARVERLERLINVT